MACPKQYVKSTSLRKQSAGQFDWEKLNEEKDRPLLITLKEEEKKRQLFQNLNKIRDAGEPFNKVIITHDLTKKQKVELKQLIEQAKEKEKEDQSGEYMYHERGLPWSWFIKKIPKKK